LTEKKRKLEIEEYESWENTRCCCCYVVGGGGAGELN
jgi:hypothetical protein